MSTDIEREFIDSYIDSNKQRPVLAYGCERHELSHWDREVEAITRKHEEGKGEKHVTRRVAEIRAILALCRTVPQPVRAEAPGEDEKQ